MTQFELYKFIENLNRSQRYQLAVKILRDIGFKDDGSLPKLDNINEAQSVESPKPFGILAGTAKIIGDIVTPMDISWDAMTQTNINPE